MTELERLREWNQRQSETIAKLIKENTGLRDSFKTLLIEADDLHDRLNQEFGTHDPNDIIEAARASLRV